MKLTYILATAVAVSALPVDQVSSSSGVARLEDRTLKHWNDWQKEDDKDKYNKHGWKISDIWNKWKDHLDGKKDDQKEHDKDDKKDDEKDDKKNGKKDDKKDDKMGGKDEGKKGDKKDDKKHY